MKAISNQDILNEQSLKAPSIATEKKTHDEEGSLRKCERISSTQTPEKQLKPKEAYSHSGTNNSILTTVQITPSPQLGKHLNGCFWETHMKFQNQNYNRDNVQIAYNVGPVDKATGLTIEALNNLHKLLPASKNPNSQSPSMSDNATKTTDTAKSIPPSPVANSLSTRELMEATGSLRPGINANDKGEFHTSLHRPAWLIEIDIFTNISVHVSLSKSM